MTSLVTHNLDLLGHKVMDVVSGEDGVVVSISFDLSGCVQAMVERWAGKDAKESFRYWVDTKRLKKLSKKPVMEIFPFAATAAFDEADRHSERGAARKTLVWR